MHKSISNIVRINLGLKPEIDLKTQEMQLKTVAYLKKINDPEIKVKREPLKEDELKEILKKTATKIISCFEYNKENTPVIQTLFYYFTKNPKFYESNVVSNEPSFNKGILLIGNTGSGKTTIIDIFKELKWQKFRKFSTYAVVEEFEKLGEKGIDTFFKGNIFFDDLGAEQEAFFYGKREVVGTRLLEKRYNLFLNDGIKTHATTNLSHKQLTEKYGFRLEGRMLEMFNIIHLGVEENSIDFRLKNHK